MSDLFGFTPEPAPFQDIRNTRASAAEEKAHLCLLLGRLVNKVPLSIRSASIQATREWTHHRDMALKVLKAKRSSVNSLQDATKQMESCK